MSGGPHSHEQSHEQSLTYTVYDPSPCSFPEPKIPLLPTFDWATVGSSARGEFVGVGDHRNSRSYKRGRYALFDAYRLCGVGPEGSLLAPAYHCRTMLDPAVRLGAELALYELDDNWRRAWSRCVPCCPVRASRCAPCC